MSWTPHLLQILLRSHGFPPRVDGVELGLAAEVVVVAPDPDLQRLYSGEDTPVESSIIFPSRVVCNRPFDARGPYGTHSIWCYLFWLGPTSSGMAI